jgi:hypothetical protein
MYPNEVVIPSSIITSFYNSNYIKVSLFCNVELPASDDEDVTNCGT